MEKKLGKGFFRGLVFFRLGRIPGREVQGMGILVGKFPGVYLFCIGQLLCLSIVS